MCLTLIESTGGLFGTSEDGRSATVAVPSKTAEESLRMSSGVRP
jgi:hypothetical protein